MKWNAWAHSSLTIFAGTTSCVQRHLPERATGKGPGGNRWLASQQRAGRHTSGRATRSRHDEAKEATWYQADAGGVWMKVRRYRQSRRGRIEIIPMIDVVSAFSDLVLASALAPKEFLPSESSPGQGRPDPKSEGPDHTDGNKREGPVPGQRLSHSTPWPRH